jgi:beta-lactam-binding protein with PASTA domain
MAVATAQTNITGLGLAVGTTTYTYNATVAYGYVISQSPSVDSEVSASTAVDLVVSLGSEPEVDPSDSLTVSATVVSSTSGQVFVIASPQLSGSYADCVVSVKSTSTGKKGIARISSYNTATNEVTLNRSIGFIPEAGDVVTIGTMNSLSGSKGGVY